jgi:hypothetical protein
MASFFSSTNGIKQTLVPDLIPGSGTNKINYKQQII